MPEDVQVFILDLGTLDALLPASDFYGAVAGDELRLRDDPRRRMPMLSVKGEDHACVFLEPHFARLFGVEEAGGGAERAAFLMRRHGREPRAVVADRGFEMKSYALSDFRLPPAGLRAHLRALGILALRFDRPDRAQYLLGPGLLEPAARREGPV